MTEIDSTDPIVQFANERMQTLCPREFDATTIYHYTDSVGLEGVLKNKTLWATNSQYLNDPLEYRYFYLAIDKALTLLRLAAGPEGTNPDAAMESFLRDFLPEISSKLYDPYHDEGAFIACFSTRRDDLSQHRLYGADGGGYCLAFDVRALQNAVKLNCPDLETSIESVRYPGEAVILQTVQDIAKKAFTLTTSVVPRTSECSPQLENSTKKALNKLWRAYAHSLKQQGFEHEHEVRLILRLSTNARAKHSGFDLRQRRGMFIPYFSLPLGDKGGCLSALTEVVIGPRLDFHPAHASTLSLLRKYGVAHFGPQESNHKLR